MEANYSTAPPVDSIVEPRSKLLLKTVFTLYREQFARWFAITAPTSLLAAAVVWAGNQKVRELQRGILHVAMGHQLAAIAAATAVRFGSYFISWLLGCFAFAAIATTVNNLDEDDVDSVWRHDSHQRARENFGRLVLAAFITFCSFLVGVVASEFVQFAAIQVVGWSHFARFIYGASLVGTVVVASVVSWLGMTIPLIVAGNTEVWAALKKSMELSDGYEGALFWLVVQSVAGSFAAWYATVYGLRLVTPVQLQHTIWYGWLVYVVAIFAGAAVEPPLFIGLSLLANPDGLKISAFPSSQEPTYVD